MTPSKRAGRRTAPPPTGVKPPSPAFVPPYPPSWLDRLLRAIERLPGPSWAGFVAVALGIAGIGLLLGLPVFEQAVSPLAWLVLGAPLAVVHYLDGVALQCLKRFAPALAAPDEEVQRLGYELTTLSRTAGRSLAAVSIALLFGIYALFPNQFPELTGLPWYRMISLLLFYALGTALFFALPVYSIHQLQLVSLIHRRATNINLLQPQPLYAFSSLTVRTGIGLLILGYGGVLASDVSQRSVIVAIFVFMVLVATGVFVLPLYGMHVRLAQQKERLLAEHQARLDAAMNSLHGMVEKPNSARADALYKVISSLMIEREILAKAPTWPWRPGTWGSFVSAVVLPIAILVISRLLERVSP